MVVRPRCRARVGCCQSNGAGYPIGCPAPLVFGYPLARQRACSNLWLNYSRNPMRSVKLPLYFAQFLYTVLAPIAHSAIRGNSLLPV